MKDAWCCAYTARAGWAESCPSGSWLCPVARAEFVGGSAIGCDKPAIGFVELTTDFVARCMNERGWRFLRSPGASCGCWPRTAETPRGWLPREAAAAPRGLQTGVLPHSGGAALLCPRLHA